MRLCATILALLVCSTAMADQRRDEAARAAYTIGKAAYENGDYQTAYDKFKESFQLSHEPALLYNIASAEQGLMRPHAAAESLRSFLRLQPNDPDRPKIEQRIATLEEEQRLLDAERRAAEKKRLDEQRRLQQSLAPAAATTAAETRAAERHRRNKALAIGLSIGGAVLVGGAVALTLALTLSKTEPFTMTALGPHPGTR
jgi:tetratricopeptide (TPR) repeat protein